MVVDSQPGLVCITSSKGGMVETALLSTSPKAKESPGEEMMRVAAETDDAKVD
jgi:hypothetical protein